MKKLQINLAIFSAFLMGALLIGLGVYLLTPSGEQSKRVYQGCLMDPARATETGCI